MPDPELYAGDLGQRRAALLRNWEQLHCSAVPPGRAPSARALRLEVETAALNALAMRLTRPAGLPESARATPESRDTPGGPRGPGGQAGRCRFSALSWPGRCESAIRPSSRRPPHYPFRPRMSRAGPGAREPSESQAGALDSYLTARGAIQKVVIDLRSRPDQSGRAAATTPLPAAQTPTLLGVMRNVARALRGSLIHNAGGQPMDGHVTSARCRVLRPRRRLHSG